VHPEILAALHRVAAQLELVGHTIMEGDPNYGIRLSLDFLARSTTGLLDWSERVGEGVTLDRRTVANMRLGRVLSENALRQARLAEAAAQRRVGYIFDTIDVVLAPTTAQPPPPIHAFDNMGTLRTNRAMVARCPVCWPWNVLGWPSINVPAGFTHDGLPIGVQLMGPQNSEPLLVSLAAELEAVSGWAAKQPEIWWNTPILKEPPTGVS
jgi:amidase